MDVLISKLSEIRSQYNCFDEAERSYYHALSEAIKVLSGRADGDTISKQAAKEQKAEESLLRADDKSVSKDDVIYRQAAIDEIEERKNANGYRNVAVIGYRNVAVINELNRLEGYIMRLPSAQPTLYGYKIEHLAYIARVMQKEGVTAEYAVRTFDDMSRALRMIIEETQDRLEKSLSAMP